jgi:molybdopterin-containing oxidoreductase family membrane subunit
MTYTYEPGRTEGLALLTKGPLAFNFWFGEILFGAVIPMVILLKTSWRKHPGYRMLALAMVVGGLIAYRWDVNLSGQMIVMPYLSHAPTTLYTSYVPSLIEIVVGAGIVAFGMIAFSYGVKYLAVVNHGVEKESIAKGFQGETSLAPGD